MAQNAQRAEATTEGRHERILRIAESLFVQEGEQRLQMKELARRAEVSLATLYQLFPSKDHILAAIALERQRRMTSRLAAGEIDGETPGERAGNVMLEEFRYIQRNPQLAAGLQRVTNSPNRSTSEYVSGIRATMEQALLAAMERDGEPVTDEQRDLLPSVLSVSYGATTGWLSGMLSVDQARDQIRLAHRMLDLPPDVVRYLLS